MTPPTSSKLPNCDFRARIVSYAGEVFRCASFSWIQVVGKISNSSHIFEVFIVVFSCSLRLFSFRSWKRQDQWQGWGCSLLKGAHSPLWSPLESPMSLFSCSSGLCEENNCAVIHWCLSLWSGHLMGTNIMFFLKFTSFQDHWKNYLEYTQLGSLPIEILKQTSM